MPLRCLFNLLLVPVLLLPWHWVQAEEAAETTASWLTREQVLALPDGQRPDMAAWCEGAWHNPTFSEAADSTDTVITANESSLTPNGLVSLSGDVRIEQPERHFRADSAQLDQATGEFQLQGNILVQTPNASLNADAFSGNTNNRSGEITGSQYVLMDVPARGEAESLLQQGDNLTINAGSYTSCPPTSNAWLLSADQIELNKEKGWGEAEDVILRVKDIPVLYLPWITFPIDDRRKSGLLFPSITSSDENGIDVIQPLYLNLHPQYDATLSPRIVSKRGEGIETEGRYLTYFGEGSLGYSGLYNDELFNNEDREIARWAHNGTLNQWQLSSDVNYASDDFYFKDLETGLGISSQTHLRRQGEAEFFGENWQFLSRVQSFQTIDPNIANSDLPYRRLPQLNLSGSQPIAGALHFDLEADYTLFKRKQDPLVADDQGDRIHAQPGVHLQFENQWGYFTPALRYYSTAYELDSNTTLPEQRPQRELIGASIRTGLVLERPASWFGDIMTQTLEPQLFANYIESVDQTNLPIFDSRLKNLSWQTLFDDNRYYGYDRIGDDHSVTLGLTSRWISAISGQERLTLRTTQRAYIQDREQAIAGETGLTDPLSPLVSDATFRLNNAVQFYLENQWDSEDNKRVANRARISLTGKRRYLHAGFIQREADNIEQGELAALTPVHTHWSVFGRWLYDAQDQRSLETLAGIEYRKCCWRINVTVQRSLEDKDGDGDLEPDRSILMQFQLTGLGGFGDQIDSLLQRSLPNYRGEND